MSADHSTTATDDCDISVEYRTIPGHPEYRVGSDGTVWTRLARVKAKGFVFTIGEVWRLMSGRVGGEWYKRVGIRGRTHTIHSLVLLTFVGPRPARCVARHLNGDKNDNRLCNLEWGTHAENETDKIAHGTALYGERANPAKLTEEAVRKIVERLKGGEKGRHLAAEYGVHEGTISKIKLGINWRRTVMCGCQPQTEANQ